MSRTLETRQARVVGGPHDGLIVAVKIKDDGTAEIPHVGAILFESGFDYWYDSATDRVVYEGADK
jgi:hypothetical protein